MPKPKGSAVIYCRISLDRTGERAGVERQETECRELAARLGLEVVGDPYVDNDISATSGKDRPDFLALLESRPTAIVVWHMDRLVRSTRELERVLDLKCPVHSVMSGQLDLSNPAGRAVAITVTAWAQYEGEIRTERQRAAHRQRKAAGKTWWSTRPFGYETHGELNEPEAEVMAMVYRGFAAGDRNLSGWARWLNDGGWTTTGKARLWSSMTVRDHLLSERNLGGPSWAPLIDEETWTVVRDVLASRTRAGGVAPIGLLCGRTGVLRCTICDSYMMTAHTSPHIKAYRHTYRCAGAGHISWPKDELDEIVEAEVRAVLAEHRAAIVAEAAPAIADASEALYRLATDFQAGRISPEDFVAASEREKARVARRATKPVVVRDWDALSHEQRRATLAVLIERIDLPRRANRGRWVPVDPEVVRDAIVWRN